MLKKKTKVVISIVVSILVIGALIFFVINHEYITPNHYYDRNWIIGKHYTEVIDRYGNFYRTIDGLCDPESEEITVPKKYSYLLRGNPDSSNDKYLEIYFDENGIAYRCELLYGWYGG